MPSRTTAQLLLRDLLRESPAMCEAIVTAAGVAPERAMAASRGETALSLSEQLRLAEAVLMCAPMHGRQARRLRSQALMAREYQDAEPRPAVPSPMERWERSALLRH